VLLLRSAKKIETTYLLVMYMGKGQLRRNKIQCPVHNISKGSRHAAITSGKTHLFSLEQHDVAFR